MGLKITLEKPTYLYYAVAKIDNFCVTKTIEIRGLMV